jgi:hypothetical protein
MKKNFEIPLVIIDHGKLKSHGPHRSEWEKDLGVLDAKYSLFLANKWHNKVL